MINKAITISPEKLDNLKYLSKNKQNHIPNVLKAELIITGGGHFGEKEEGIDDQEQMN